MFFRKTKKRWAITTIKLIDHLKVTLYTILMDEFKMALFIQGNQDKSRCEELGKIYAAFVINRLFGDSNAKVIKGNKDLFQNMDYYHEGTAGVILEKKYPEILPIITDAILRYHKAFGNLGKENMLAPKQEVFNNALKMGLIVKDYKPILDKEFVDTIKSVDSKRKIEAQMINDLFK